MSGSRSTVDEDPDDDQALARRAQEREPGAWSALFERHYRTVYAFVRYRLRGADDAEDIASQVFEVAYRNADRFDYRGVPIEGWLIGIARNLVRVRVKKLGRRGFTAELEEDTVTAAAPDEVSAVDLQQDLGEFLQRLNSALKVNRVPDREVE